MLRRGSTVRTGGWTCGSSADITHGSSAAAVGTRIISCWDTDHQLLGHGSCMERYVDHQLVIHMDHQLILHMDHQQLLLGHDHQLLRHGSGMERYMNQLSEQVQWNLTITVTHGSGQM